MVIMRTVFQNFKRKMSEACYCEIFSRNRCSFNLILDFDNKLKEGTNDFCKTLSDVATKIQPKPNVVTTSCVSWVNMLDFLSSCAFLFVEAILFMTFMVFKDQLIAISRYLYMPCVDQLY